MYPLTVNKMTSDVITMAIPLHPISVLEPTGIDIVPVFNGEALHVLVRNGGRALVTVGTIPAAERLVMGIPMGINIMCEADLDKVQVSGRLLPGGLFNIVKIMADTCRFRTC